MSEEMTTVGRVQVRRWPAEDPQRLVVLVHGYGEHIGRYAHVAEALVARGSSVVGPDHVGHGQSDGEQALVEDFEPVVDDLRAVVQDARGDLPVVMVVGNNGIWGLEKHPMQFIYGWDVACDLQPDTRYDDVVKSLGGGGETVTRPDKIGPALDRAFASGVPYLVNVMTDPSDVYPRTSNLA